jgi:hypothetical protein
VSGKPLPGLPGSSLLTLQGLTCNVLGMETKGNKMTESATNRGWDRGFTARKDGSKIDADQTATNLYPDDTEKQNACAAGVRKGWKDAGK